MSLDEFSGGGQTALGTQQDNAAAAPFEGGVGQSKGDAQFCHANPTPLLVRGGQILFDTQAQNAPTNPPLRGDDLESDDTQIHAAIAPLIAEIREQHRMRVDFHRAEKRLTLQIKSVCRRLCGGDKKEANLLYTALKGGDHPLADVALGYLMPLIATRDTLAEERKRPEKTLEKLALQLPVWAWVKPINGFGKLGLAQIVAEAGDLSNYANPGKLWKRMGLAVIDGQAQRRVSGAAALDHNYAPERRSLMYCIGDSLIKKDNPYRALYLERKAYEETKTPDATKMLWHRRAQRYMEKRLLRDLWRAWRLRWPESTLIK